MLKPVSGYTAVVMRAFANNPTLGNALLYSDTAPRSRAQPQPIIVFERIGGVPLYFTEGQLGDRRNARVQLEIWTNHPASREAVLDRVLEIVAQSPDMEQLTEALDLYDENVELYGSRVDVSVWFPR